jgi:hypothetical protein
MDLDRLAENLNASGHARLPLLEGDLCRELACLFDREDLFRAHVLMQRHGFGQGEYKYFADPLPAAVAELRARLYPALATIANDWAVQLRETTQFPDELGDYLAQCHAAGQLLPTPLLLRYRTGDYNCLHQDLYGEHVFPLQLTVLLSDPKDFSGGEFLLVEQRPRMQSRGEVVALAQGEAVIFPVRHRPVQGSRGVYRATMRHGVSRVRSGLRQTLGIIFHDAA